MVTGDRVRLRKDIAHNFTHRKTQGGHRVDWTKREGSVVSIGLVNQTVTIKWDDRRTLDYWPVRALVPK